MQSKEVKRERLLNLLTTDLPFKQNPPSILWPTKWCHIVPLYSDAYSCEMASWTRSNAEWDLILSIRHWLDSLDGCGLLLVDLM